MGARRFMPEIFDTENWKEFLFKDSQYGRKRAGPGLRARGR